MSHFLNLSDLTETADGGAGGSGSGGPVSRFNSQFMLSQVTNPGIPVPFHPGPGPNPGRIEELQVTYETV